MLAASAVAADHGDLAAALSHACVAGALAEGNDLAVIRIWASWQQGRLQLISGDTDGALASFCRAASAEITSREGTAMPALPLSSRSFAIASAGAADGSKPASISFMSSGFVSRVLLKGLLPSNKF